mmetsp:Transcript_23590/g.34951  ORF Transcript_23590/g.34951 Transcript_23590/m.34951 type:complete len:201 (+) Transcript_23590:514-1116(+)
MLAQFIIVCILEIISEFIDRHAFLDRFKLCTGFLMRQEVFFRQCTPPRNHGLGMDHLQTFFKCLYIPIIRFFYFPVKKGDGSITEPSAKCFNACIVFSGFIGLFLNDLLFESKKTIQVCRCRCNHGYRCGLCICNCKCNCRRIRDGFRNGSIFHHIPGSFPKIGNILDCLFITFSLDVLEHDTLESDILGLLLGIFWWYE